MMVGNEGGRPVEPRFRAAQRVRYLLRYYEGGAWTEYVGEGWARVQEDCLAHRVSWKAAD